MLGDGLELGRKYIHQRALCVIDRGSIVLAAVNSGAGIIHKHINIISRHIGLSKLFLYCEYNWPNLCRCVNLLKLY